MYLLPGKGSGKPVSWSALRALVGLGDMTLISRIVGAPKMQPKQVLSLEVCFLGLAGANDANAGRLSQQLARSASLDCEREHTERQAIDRSTAGEPGKPVRGLGCLAAARVAGWWQHPVG
jgi:hypothetical protein